MNLLQSDVLNARNALRAWDIPEGKVFTGWHDGHVSVIIDLSEKPKDTGLENTLREVLRSQTTISIPVVVKWSPEKKTFKFNFKAS